MDIDKDFAAAMDGIETLTRSAYELVISYFFDASRLAQDRDISLVEALKVVVANRRSNRSFGVGDSVAAFRWIQMDLYASFYFQAAVVRGNHSVLNGMIAAHIERGRALTLTENEISMLATYEILHHIGTITDPLSDMADGGIAWHGLRGAYMMINTIRHGFANANVVDDDDDDDDDDDADDANDENAHPNVRS